MMNSDWQWQSKAAGDVSAAIIDLFYSYGPPQRLLSDQGREFINEVWHKYTSHLAAYYYFTYYY